MSDLEQTEGGQEQASAGLPIPKLESASAGSATSGVDTKAIAKEVAEILKPDFERVAQSTKDKRIAALEKKLGVSDLAELESLGAQIPDNVKLEYRLREMEQKRTPDYSDQPKASPGNGAELTAQDVSEVIRKFKLDANDPQVLEKLRGTYRNSDHFQATMAEIALARVSQSPASPAASSTLNAAQPPSKDRQAELQKEFDEKVKNLRGIDVANLKLEYRRKGLDIS